MLLSVRGTFATGTHRLVTWAKKNDRVTLTCEPASQNQKPATVLVSGDTLGTKMNLPQGGFLAWRVLGETNPSIDVEVTGSATLSLQWESAAP